MLSELLANRYGLFERMTAERRETQESKTLASRTQLRSNNPGEGSGLPVERSILESTRARYNRLARLLCA